VEDKVPEVGDALPPKSMDTIGERGVVDRDDGAVPGNERRNPLHVQPIWRTELDRGGAGDLFGERADPDAVPVDDGTDVTVPPDDVAVLEVAVGPAVRPIGLIGGRTLRGVFLDERDALVE
jgi:hypothetical protein